MPVDVSFATYSTTFLNDPKLSESYYVILDEIAVDGVEMTYNDDKL